MVFWDSTDRMLTSQLSILGEPITIFVGSPAVPYSVRGIFDAAPAQADLGLQERLSNQAPTVGFRSFDLPGSSLPKIGQRVTCRGVDFEISDVEPDGSGHCRCRLFVVGSGHAVPNPVLST
jgi:hypothetical protein